MSAVLVTLDLYRMEKSQLSDDSKTLIRNLFPEHVTGFNAWLETPGKNYFAIDKQLRDLQDIELLGLPDDVITIKPYKRLTLQREAFQKLTTPGHSERFNQGNAVHIHLPGFDLHRMRSLTHVDNACSDEVAKYIKEGWMILAILPQPHQRRPDYILGHLDRDVRL